MKCNVMKWYGMVWHGMHAYVCGRVRIYTHARLNLPESRKAGHRVYDEVPFILVKFDNRDDAVSRPVTEEDKRHFPQEWEAYEASLESAQDPEASVLPACTVALARELSDMGLVKISALLANAERLDPRFKEVVKQATTWALLHEEQEDNDDR